jgi:hypothetical protein
MECYGEKKKKYNIQISLYRPSDNSGYRPSDNSGGTVGGTIPFPSMQQNGVLCVCVGDCARVFVDSSARFGDLWSKITMVKNKHWSMVNNIIMVKNE